MKIENAHVFREYDIRGVADRDLPDSLAHALGRALGTMWSRRGGKRVSIGRDCRLSGDRLHAALLRGIVECGLSVVDIGMGPTPLLYFSVFHLDLDGGVHVTGSHNPPHENGFKMMAGKGTLAGEEIAELRAMIEREDFDLRPGGTVVVRDLTAAYVGFARGNIRLGRRNVRFAVDAGSGAAGPLALAAMRALGLDPVAILCEPDGRFPVHHPDPSQPENLEMLVRAVRDQRLELGIAFDGDGDRIGVIDARGEVIYGDRLLALFAREVLARRPGAAIIGEVKCSQTLYDDIARHGGRPILWKTGHSLIKRKMKEEHALLAGEMSGHVFFADRFFGFDDALYAALRLLEIVSLAGAPLHELFDGLPETISTPELRVDASDATKFEIVRLVRDHYRGTRKVIDIDGARVLFDGGWGLVRASNTQPVLVLRFEADTEARLSAIRTDVEATVERARVALS